MRQYLFLFAGLLLTFVGYAQTSTITMKTNKAIGDSIFIGFMYDSEDFPEISIEGAEGKLHYIKDTLVLTSQIVTIKGDSIIGLYCNGNELVSLDITKCPTLLEIECRKNLLQNLNLSGCTKLVNLDCSNNELRELDVSGNLELTSLGCKNNRLSQLDVSKIKYLKWLECDHNELSTIHLSNIGLNSFSCSNNKLKELDLSGIKVLESIDCSYNELTSLDLSNITTFELFLYGNKFSACALDSIFTQLSEKSQEMNDLIQSPTFCSWIAWYFSVFIKDGDVSTPGTDGCCEYIATDKKWDVMDYNNGNPIKISNVGHYVCAKSGMGIEEIEPAFSLFPNPVYDELCIKGSTEIKSIAVYSLTGKLFKQVQQSEMANDYSLNLSGYPSGIYILQINTSNGVWSEKIIKK